MATKAGCTCGTFYEKLRRKKVLPADVMQTKLHRCLNAVDLLLFGMGHMVGGGVYVLTGTVARDTAGPGVVFSYAIAGLVSVLVALCYAEFGSKIPKAGSAYLYTYVMLGEFFAFFVGWNVVLEQAIGGAAIARAWSGAVDVLSGGAVVNGTIRVFGSIHEPFLSSYPDLLAVALLVFLTAVVAAGIRVNSLINNILTVTNVIFLTFVIIVSFIYAEPSNWLNAEGGGPLPFGFTGVLAGSAMCFFAYAGFECVTQAAEETVNPSRAVPRGIIGAMAIVTTLYVTTAIAMTMLVPYSTLDLTVPFSRAFQARGVIWMTYVASVGTIVATTTTALASLFALARIIYVMAEDRLFFSCFAYVHPKTQTPIVAAIVFGIITMIAAAIIDIEELAEMLSAGTLMAFSFLGIDVLVLRYTLASQCPLPLVTSSGDIDELTNESTPLSPINKSDEATTNQNPDNIGRLKPRFARWRVMQYITTHLDYHLPLMAIYTLCLSGFSCLVIILRATDYLTQHTWWSILLAIVFGLVALTSFLTLLMYEHNVSLTSFQVPWVPLLPTASFLLNSALLIRLSALAWIRVGVWNAAGFLVYFLYGIHFSVERLPSDKVELAKVQQSTVEEEKQAQ